jgi:hypothetical protein
MADAPPTAWLIHTGAAGFRVQCEGLAAALGLAARTVQVAPPAPFRWIAPLGPPAPNAGFRPPFPDIAIGSGRQAVPYMRRLAKAGSFTVFLQNPQVPTSTFDLVWAPAHDRLQGPNVIVTSTSPHDLTAAKLEAASRAFAETFDALPKPLIGVVVGGANGVFAFGAAEIDRLAADLAALVRATGAGIALTPSRRTGTDNIARLRAALADLPAYVWDLEGPNPYHAILARADRLLVTCDSVNMVGEAAFTGKPVYMVRLPGGSPKFARFHAGVIASGGVKWFEGALEKWVSPPLNATGEIAGAVGRAYLAKTGKALR